MAAAAERNKNTAGTQLCSSKPRNDEADMQN